MDSMEKDLEGVLSNPEQRKALAEFISTLKKKEDDWRIISEYYITAANIRSADESTKLFSEMEKEQDFNRFESKEECDRWAKKLNALHKLRLIANHLNGDWIPNWFDGDEEKHCLCAYYTCSSVAFTSTTTLNVQESYLLFKSGELASRAIELMGKRSLKDLFEIE